MPKRIAITVDGFDYPSIKQAWRAESPDGLDYKTVLWRLKHGWSPNMAVVAPLSWGNRWPRQLELF